MDLAGLKQWRFPAWAENLASKWIYPLLDQPQWPHSRGRNGGTRVAATAPHSEPLHAASRQQQSQNVIPAELVENLQSMFPAAEQGQILQALQASNGNPEQAVAILLSTSSFVD
ncbi:hypothetical protein IWW36_004669 [Coemansia brasiliensis]|uniref:CUE domain-containing protein n=1 Tax=Coemansia brasiliensis TaxID=2650707 RepID=A0A9W8I2W9_9FUNG|nr:hypothetical protein IWW36_004669 [Coemansia brasiliensis]